MTWRLPLALAAASAIGLASVSVIAAEHPRVVLEIDPCVTDEPAEVRRIVGVELGGLLVDASAPGADVTRIRARCGAATELRVDDPITKKSLERAVDLSRYPVKTRARLLALAIAELVTASWTELEANPEPRVPAVGPPVDAARAQGAREVVRARTAPGRAAVLRLIGAFSARGFPGHTGLLIGGTARVAADAALFGWSLDAGADHGSQVFTPLGKVGTTTVSLAPTFAIHKSLAALVVRGAIGARGGAAILSGEAPATGVRASTVAGPWLGPTAMLSVSASPAAPLAMELTVDGGWVVVPVSGKVAGAPAVAIDGGWIGATLGVGLVP